MDWIDVFDMPQEWIEEEEENAMGENRGTSFTRKDQGFERQEESREKHEISRRTGDMPEESRPVYEVPDVEEPPWDAWH